MLCINKNSPLAVFQLLDCASCQQNRSVRASWFVAVSVITISQQSHTQVQSQPWPVVFLSDFLSVLGTNKFLLNTPTV